MESQTLTEENTSGLQPLQEVNATAIQVPLDSKEPEQDVGNRNIEECSDRVFFMFKVSMFFICSAGFIYQAGQFLHLYWKYPTVIDLAVEKPEYIIDPAVTFCSSATIVRKKYCDKYPDQCKIIEVAIEPICKNNPDYCAGNGTHDWIPKQRGLPISHFPRHVLKHLVKNVTDMFYYIYSHNNVEGPFVYYGEDKFKTLFCYTIYSRVESSYKPSVAKLNKLYPRTYKFHVYPSEVLDPWTEAGMHIHFHSPFMAVNPAIHGTFLKPGKKYILHVHLEKERLLPPPYSTNCKNYYAAWEQNKWTGARTQKMCMAKCEATFDLICSGCVRLENLYPFGQKCDILQDVIECEKEHSIWNETKDCLNTCRPDCVKLKYDYTIQERNFHSRIELARDPIELSVFLDQNEVPVWMHKPKYEDVELFSYLGGFLGCWLGISLYAFADIIKSVYRSICYLYRKIELKRIRLKLV